jgi:hexosaminidase
MSPWLHRLAFLSLVAVGTHPDATRPAGPRSAVVHRLPAPDRRHTLMPVPSSLTWEAGALRLDTATTLVLTHFANDRLRRGLRRTIARLESATGVPLPHEAAGLDLPPVIAVAVDSAGQRVQGVDEDESYSLVVGDLGARLHAHTVVGALRGFETLLQLVESDSGGFYLPAVRIEDSPRFPWRGLLLDVGRHFMPVDEVERTLDGMAAVKLNVLHWHLSEDQGFRVESKRYPKLQQLGSDGLFYTQDQVREVVAYARDRGIRVVPEFDMPGHSTSWFVGYPQLASHPGPYEIARTFGEIPSAFDPSREAVYTFIDRFIGEMARLFPDRYWHVGGDEVNRKEWDANRHITAFKRAHHLRSDGQLQAYFNRRLDGILVKYGKRMVGWDEVLDPGLPKSAVVQSWRDDYLARTTAAGHRALLSAPYYLDHMETAEAHYNADPIPPTTDLTPAQQKLILGGEACMWAEHVTAETVDSRIWPRLAAIAERFWSPQGVIQVNDMYRRLRAENERLEQLGLGQEAHAARMVRRLTSDRELQRALETMLEAIAPPTFGQRIRGQGTTQLTPLVRIVDAAVPDPPGRWETSMLVDRLLSDTLNPLARIDTTISVAEARRRLRQLLARWHAAADSVEHGPLDSPLLLDAVPAAAGLSRVAAIGLQALDHLEGRNGSPDGWGDAALTELEGLEAPQNLLRIVIVRPVRRLVLQAIGYRL